MSYIRFLKISILLSIISVLSFSCREIQSKDELDFQKKSLSVSKKGAQNMAEKLPKSVALDVHEDLEVSLWAGDSIVVDPVAISIDENGKMYYVSGSRLTNSEFDIRGHQDWMTASISFQTVEDRRAFLRKIFSETNEAGEQFLKDLNDDGQLDWRDLTVEKEQIWILSDSDSDGLADRSDLFAEGFHEEITDLANGVEFSDGEVFLSVGPDLWRVNDTDGDGLANTARSISHGYAVHIGFGAHGMSGPIIGPAGRVWWGIGDIGMNVIDKSGKQWKYPNRGVVVRADRDGSNFEVFSMGVRNTHEFVFDKYGNLITVDNDGDHPGERERLVYLVDGSDSGWRINWQFGKYTDPKNNRYKVWMDEKMSVPRWDDQAAYFIPPIQNYVNGPTGMVYNPGTALSPDWKDYFFISEFRGTPSNSPIHAFKMKPEGASFALDTTMEVVKGSLPTGIDWGPEGAMYFGDWITGWGTKDYGRIWKVDVNENQRSAIRLRTKGLIQSDFNKKSIADLYDLLAYEDMRIRHKAQFELVKRIDGYDLLKRALSDESQQIRRIHAIWGIAQLGRKDVSKAQILTEYLNDSDDEIVAQCAKYIGDVKCSVGESQLIQLVNHSNPRIQFFATEALGRIGSKASQNSIIQMIKNNDEKDVYLRHAGSLALSRIGDKEFLEGLYESESRAVHIAAVLALRRMSSPAISKYLESGDDYIIAEIARAINDDFSIKESLPDLAELLTRYEGENEVIIRRAINACVRVGRTADLKKLVDYIVNENAPSAMRAEAISAVTHWEEPSVLDRVTGRYRGEVKRNEPELKNYFIPQLANLINDENGQLAKEAMNSAGVLNVISLSSQIENICKSSSKSDIRKAALESLALLRPKNLQAIIADALEDSSPVVRATAIALISSTDLADSESVVLFERVLDNPSSSLSELQSSLNALGKIASKESAMVLISQYQKMKDGSLNTGVELDLLSAMEGQNDLSVIELLEKHNAQYEGDEVGPYLAALDGGNVHNGKMIFRYNAGAQCVRCHAVWEYGGDAGPGLQGIADRLTKKQLLESLVAPSARLAEGYAVASFTLSDESVIAGYIKSETGETIGVEMGDKKYVEISKSDIMERQDIPSSMPDMKNVLSKTEIRDVVAYLSSLSGDAH